MALAKTNPLPVGRYTMDLPPARLPRLAAWTKANRGKVVVHTCITHPQRGIVVTFDVVGKPGAFPFGAVGYPTVASSSTGSLLDDAFGVSSSELEAVALLVALYWLFR